MQKENLTPKQLKQFAEHVGCPIDEIDFDDYSFYTDEEADAACANYIRESICFFRPEFLMAHVKDNITLECIQALQEKYESANPALLALIDDFDHLVQDAIAADGRGHFLSFYDGHEIELWDEENNIIFAYRDN